MDALTKKNF